MGIVFWVIVTVGAIGAIQSTSKLNTLCEKEVEEGNSTTIKECKQYHFDNRAIKGW